MPDDEYRVPEDYEPTGGPSEEYGDEQPVDDVTDEDMEHGDLGRGLENLDPRENILEGDADDFVGDSYEPPDVEPQALLDRPTEEEEREGESLDERLSEEEPDEFGDYS